MPLSCIMNGYPVLKEWFYWNTFDESDYHVNHMQDMIAPYLLIGKNNTLACVPEDADPNADVSKYP